MRALNLVTDAFDDPGLLAEFDDVSGTIALAERQIAECGHVTEGFGWEGPFVHPVYPTIAPRRTHSAEWYAKGHERAIRRYEKEARAARLKQSAKIAQTLRGLPKPGDKFRIISEGPHKSMIFACERSVFLHKPVYVGNGRLYDYVIFYRNEGGQRCAVSMFGVDKL